MYKNGETVATKLISPLYSVVYYVGIGDIHRTDIYIATE